MTCTAFKRVLPASVLVLPLLLGLSSLVAAQAPAKPEQAKPTQTVEQKEGRSTVKEEVTVTGTMIPREDLTSLSPVAIVSVEEVTYQGTGPRRGPDPAAAAGLRGAELHDLQRRVGHGDGRRCATWARSAR